MAAIEGSHAPNNECSHLLHPAGYQNPIPKNVFRYNRVTPYYPPDPCISPTEGDLMCPPDEVPPMRNHAWMPAAGNDIRPPSDAFRYYKVFPPATGNRCKPGNQQECPDNGPVCQVDVCPCTHRPRYAPSYPRSHFDYRYPAGPTDCSAITHERGSFPETCKGEINQTQVCSASNSWQQGASATSNSPQHSVPQAMFPWKPPQEQQFNMGNYPVVQNQSCARCNPNTSDAPDPYSVIGNLTYGGNYVMNRNVKSLAQQPSGIHKNPVRSTDTIFGPPNPNCLRPYHPSPYICRPVYNRKYLMDCPEQDGPPGDSYTFL
ncbi:unnamed protein product [Lymnaea stagnalis]|uniref:Uncharacterized protein n=1 Tax=Lymnaea stagnalis TaxID=6523 RepID=A0AAV2HTN9_LYMST